MSALHQQVRRTIRRHELCPPGTRVLVGLSGGSDSVALDAAPAELAEHGGFSVVGLAHFNHRLRRTADRDEEFCRDFAARLGLPIVGGAHRCRLVRAVARLSVEDAARRLRYDFLERAAEPVGADRIAVGHTQDDQAETFLLKLMRGAGLTGLGGIYPRRDSVIRPLLDVVARRPARLSRIAGQSVGRGRDERAISTNPRNRIRHGCCPSSTCAGGRDPLARHCPSGRPGPRGWSVAR